MRNVKILATGLLLLMLASTSCKKQEISPVDQQTPQIQQKEGLIVLGKQLEDPYAIKNMKKAYSKLKSENVDVPDVEILPNRIYLRFLPKNEKEWGILKSDTSLVLFDYPLNFEIVNLGTYYHDPSLTDSTITWQYCVVPMDYVIPPVEHEILYEAFIPPVEDSTSLKSANELQNFYGRLEDESNKLTGNAPKDKTPHTKGWFSSQWRPKGTLTYYDNSLGSIQPIAQATVHARYFIHVETTLSRDNGYFETNKFRCDVNYSIKWQRQDFEIREGRVGQAWFNGPNQKGDWNLTIWGGMSRMYAIIHHAAYDYYYNNHFGIQSPPRNYWYNNILSIGAFDWEDVDPNGDTAPWRRWTGTAEIRIFKPSRVARDIYATTIHELAHASHWDLAGRFNFYNADLNVAESWARGVQWEFTRKIYPTYYIDYSRRDYTGIVEDMIDGNKTRTSYYHSTYSVYSAKSYSDQVSGYTLQQIEQALKGARTYFNWRDNLKNLYNNGTENNLDAAFNYWND